MASPSIRLDLAVATSFPKELPVLDQESMHQAVAKTTLMTESIQ